MKRIILLAACIFGLAATSVKAQSYLKPITSDAVHAAGLDTATNTTAVTKSVKVTGWYDAVVIQSTVTKLTGTPGGTVICQGSVDNVQWSPVGDTLTVANTSGAQTHRWVDKPGLFQYYKLIYTPTGTQTSKILGEALLRRYDNN